MEVFERLLALSDRQLSQMFPYNWKNTAWKSMRQWLEQFAKTRTGSDRSFLTEFLEAVESKSADIN